MTHMTQTIDHVNQGELDAMAKGYTQAFEAEGGDYVLSLLVKPGTDLDGSFTAWECDEGEYLTVHGWLFTFEEV